MDVICSLLPGADQPIQSDTITDDDDDDDYEEVEDEEMDDDDDNEEEEEVQIVDEFPTTRNGDDDKLIKKTLPQPTNEMTKPLNLDVDPVCVLF